MEKHTDKRTKILITICFCVLIIVLVIGVKNIGTKLMYPIKYENYIEKYAKEEEIEEELIYAIIKNESNFKPDAISNKNALGLMQLMENTAYEVEKEFKMDLDKNQILEPENNIKLGTRYLSNLIKKYNSTELALAAYNAGSGNVDKWIKDGVLKEDGSDIENIPFKETNNYIRRILRDYKIYKKLL